MGMSTTHLLMLVAVVVLLFGRNKISELMGDVGRGIKSFRTGLAEDEQQPSLKSEQAPGAQPDVAATRLP